MCCVPYAINALLWFHLRPAKKKFRPDEEMSMYLLFKVLYRSNVSAMWLFPRWNRTLRLRNLETEDVQSRWCKLRDREVKTVLIERTNPKKGLNNCQSVRVKEGGTESKQFPVPPFHFKNYTKAICRVLFYQKDSTESERGGEGFDIHSYA